MAEVDTGIYAPLMKDVNPNEQVNNLLDTVAKSQAVKQQAIGIDAAKFELAMKNVGAVNSVVGSLLGDPDTGKTDITKKIIDATTRLVKDNHYSAQHVTEFLKTFPTDPARQAIALRNIHSQLQSAAERGQSFFGTPQALRDGMGTSVSQFPQYPGLEPRERGYFHDQMPPNTETIQSDPRKPNFNAPTYLGPSGPPGLQPPRSAGGPPPGFPAGPAPAAAPGVMPATTEAPARAMVPSSAKVVGDREGLANGLYEGATPAQRVAGAHETARPQQILRALPPDVVAARTGATEVYNTTMEAAGKYANRVLPLRQAIPILEKMKETDIGPTSERWNDIKSTAQTIGLGKMVAAIDSEKISEYNKLKKYFAQYASQASATLGPKTNDGLATAITSNPNVNMDKLSATDLSKVALGAERMQQAGALEFKEALKNGSRQPGDFNDFMLDWSTNQDPRAFVYDIMSEKAQNKIDGLKGNELKKFLAGFNLAKKWKLIGDVHRE